jgi:hypothetical protein
MLLVQLLCLWIGSPPSDAAAQQASTTQCNEAIRGTNHAAMDRFSQPLSMILSDAQSYRRITSLRRERPNCWQVVLNRTISTHAATP